MPADVSADAWPRLRPVGLMSRVRAFAQRRRWLMLLVVAPTVVAAVYMLLFSAPQYVSEARFMVRSQGAQGAGSILGQVIGAATGGGAAPATDEAQGVVSFIGSHDAVSALRKDMDLVAVWRRNGLDVFAGARAHPKDEDLQRTYDDRVKSTLNSGTGIVTLTVRTFRPEDSKLIAEKLLGYSEALVNQFSERAERDALRVSQAEVDRMAGKVTQLSAQLQQFRDQRQTLDPQGSAKVVTEVVGGLEAQVARARAELASLRTYLKPGTPRLVEQETRLRALEGQLASQNARLTGGQNSLAPTVGGFERISTEREIANRGYASALASLEAARIDALKQHSYLVRVVEPNLPQKSTFPHRGLTVLSIFGGLLLAYAIGWLVVQGMREHAA